MSATIEAVVTFECDKAGCVEKARHTTRLVLEYDPYEEPCRQWALVPATLPDGWTSWGWSLGELGCRCPEHPT